jgi:hypothetical protein
MNTTIPCFSARSSRYLSRPDENCSRCVSVADLDLQRRDRNVFRKWGAIGDDLHAGARRHGRDRRPADAFVMPRAAWRRCAPWRRSDKSRDGQRTTLIFRLHPDDIRALAHALAQELRPARSSSHVEVGASGHGDQCDPKKKTTNQRGSMGPRSTDGGGESLSSQDAEEAGRELIRNLRQSRKRGGGWPAPATRRKASS